MEKYGLVLEGGGVRGAYTAGALAWLSDNNITFDYNVGISTGALYLCCYLVKNKKAAYNMAVNYANSPECVGLRAFKREGHYVAYKYIVDEFLIHKEHLDISPIIDQKMPMDIGCYDLSKGETVYFGPEKMDKELVLLRGACSLPIASAVVEYNGMRLLDGGITKMIPIERALEQGCTKCLVITTKPADYVRKPASPIIKAMMKNAYKDCPQIVKDYGIRHLNYYKQVNIIKNLVGKGDALYILPSENIKVSRFKGDSEKTKKLYDLGYNDMEARKEEIFAFMKGKSC